MPDHPPGRVLVVPTAEFRRLGPFQGFRAGPAIDLDALLAPGVAEFRPRAEVEDDPSYKQLIPYVILRAGGLVFRYTRGGTGGEARLRQLHSIGVGGHVDEADADGRATRASYDVALRRELAEELVLDLGDRDTPPPVGFINDDDTPVGRVHLGVVHLVDLDSPHLEVREAALADPRFVALDELVAGREALESWSRHCLEGLLLPAEPEATVSPDRA